MKVRTMESDGADAINWCIKRKILKLIVRYDKKKGGWSVDQAYCCKKHTPELILNSQLQKIRTVSENEK